MGGALTPFSVDGMIVAASATLLADCRAGERGGVLPWALLVAGSTASLAANVAVAAWPSFAFIGAYEILMRQVRRSAAVRSKPPHRARRCLSDPGLGSLGKNLI
jgi:hypothetical protein